MAPELQGAGPERRWLAQAGYPPVLAAGPPHFATALAPTSCTCTERPPYCSQVIVAATWSLAAPASISHAPRATLAPTGAVTLKLLPGRTDSG